MIRNTIFAAATAIALGAGLVGVGGIAAPTEAQAQWRDYDRGYYGRDYRYDRRYDRRRYDRKPAYRPQRQVYGQGYEPAPAGPGGRGRAGVLPNGRPYYTPPGGQLPNGQSYTTPGGAPPNAQRDNGYN